MSQICHDLHQMANKLHKFRFPLDSSQLARLPKNGIYVLFEEGETAHGINRIVRVGTHTGDNQLIPRLTQHFVMKNKDRSIFRKNIGRAFLHKDRDDFLKEWNRDLTTRTAREKYYNDEYEKKRTEVEWRVSKHMEKFSFVLLKVDTQEDRLSFESKIISTVATCGENHASDNWLGNESPVKKIKESGMWLVKGLNKEKLTRAELELLSNAGVRSA